VEQGSVSQCQYCRRTQAMSSILQGAGPRGAVTCPVLRYTKAEGQCLPLVVSPASQRFGVVYSSLRQPASNSAIIISLAGRRQCEIFELICACLTLLVASPEARPQLAIAKIRNAEADLLKRRGRVQN
jgi:hypothetical protein